MNLILYKIYSADAHYDICVTGALTAFDTGKGVSLCVRADVLGHNNATYIEPITYALRVYLADEWHYLKHFIIGITCKTEVLPR